MKKASKIPEIAVMRHDGVIFNITMTSRIDVRPTCGCSFLSFPRAGKGMCGFSHIPMHTRWSDPYVSSLLEKSVPHRYPCEISVTNTR